MAHLPEEKLAWFIEPEGELRARIEQAKTEAARHWPEATYLHHPPHSTLLFGRFADSPELRAAFSAVAASSTPFDLEIAGPCVFANDVPAGGGQTLALAVRTPAPALFELQRSLAESMAAHRIRSAVSPVFSDPAWNESQQRFGFPFVGSHWRPHFTIASLPVGQNAPPVSDWLARPASFYSPVRGISLWRVCGEHHERLATASLSSR